MLDLRVPTGLFFAATGLILVLLGMFSRQARSSFTSVNVNLYAGLAMLVFGLFMLAMTRKRS